MTHHVGGYLKIAPEHSEDGPLTKMMKPGMGSYYEFKEMFERFSKEAGQEAVSDSLLHFSAPGFHK